MDHDVLRKKLANLDEEIRLAHCNSLPGSELLAKVCLTLDDAIRVAANIRNRLEGVLHAKGRQDSLIGMSATASLRRDIPNN